MADPIKQDGSATGLRIALEESFGVLPTTPEWIKQEPNRYGGDFGAKIGTVARQPIVADRQNQKGVVSDLDANASFETDLVQNSNLIDLLFPGFFFADFQDKPSTQARGETAVALTAVVASSDQFQAASGLDTLGLVANHLIKATNFTDLANNGLHLVSTVASGAVTVTSSLVDDGAPGATTKIEAVGYQFPAGTLSVVMTGSIPTLTRASGSIDYTTIGIAAGDVLFLGGDAATQRFASTSVVNGRTVRRNSGWVRVRSVAAAGIVLDLTQYTMAAETSVAVAATGVLTMASNPANATTVTLGGTTYTFQTSLVDSANNVQIGADPDETCDNLIAAINAGAGAGTAYGTGTTANAQLSGSAGSGDTISLLADSAGVAGNSIATTDTAGAAITFGAATLTGGADAIAVRVFFGHKLTNATTEDDIVRRTYQIERTLGADDTTTPTLKQSEYIEGAVPNVLDMKIPLTNKIAMDLQFVGKEHTQRTGAEGLKSGDRPALTSAAAFGTSSDARRMRLHVQDLTTANASPLFAFLRELTLNINNNITPNKAVTVLGPFEMSTGQFDVTGSMTAYFAKNSALAAIRNNSTVGLNFQVARDNKGMAFDIPSATLQGGPPGVELNAPIMLPLTFNAFKDDTLGYTIAFFEYPYLPSEAETPITVS